MHRAHDRKEAENALKAVDTASSLDEKLRRLISELSLDAHEEELLAVREQLDEDLTPEGRYVQALKWLAMSQQQLYIRYSKDDPAAAARFLSYALLKRHPDKQFKAEHESFRAGKLSASAWAQRIVSDPGFEDFLQAHSIQRTICWWQVLEHLPRSTAKHPPCFDHPNQRNRWYNRMVQR